MESSREKVLVNGFMIITWGKNKYLKTKIILMKQIIFAILFFTVSLTSKVDIYDGTLNSWSAITMSYPKHASANSIALQAAMCM